MTGPSPDPWTLRQALGGPGWWLGTDGRWHPPEDRPSNLTEDGLLTMNGALGGPGWWLGPDGRWHPPVAEDDAEAGAAAEAPYEPGIGAAAEAGFEPGTRAAADAETEVTAQTEAEARETGDKIGPLQAVGQQGADDEDGAGPGTGADQDRAGRSDAMTAPRKRFFRWGRKANPTSREDVASS